MSKVLDYKYSSSEVDTTSSAIFKKLKETNDCSVRAIASAVEVDYDKAHTYTAKVLEREPRKGCINMIHRIANLIKGDSPVQKIGNVQFEYEYIRQKELKNRYKLHGEVIYRKKTVKSFIDAFRKGTFLVFVADHVFTVKDGVMVDNNGEEFRPTRKVIGAIKVNVKSSTEQLELFSY